MSRPKHSAAGLLEGSAAILTAVGAAIRGTPGGLEPRRGALLRLGRTSPVVAALLVLFLAAGMTGSFTPRVQAQETEECDYVWCASATVKDGAGSANDVGYKPGTDYPGSTLDPTTFTHKEVTYTVGGIVNDLDDGEVTLLLSPLPDADTVRPLTFRVGATVLPFGEGTRSEADGAYSWTDSTEFGTGASPFADDASIEFTIAKDALPGTPNIYLASGSNGDRITLVWNRPSHGGVRRIEGYKVEVSEDSGSSWTVLAENELSTAFAHSGLLADTTNDYRVSALNSIGAGEPSATVSGSTGPGQPPRSPTSLSADGGNGTITLSWGPPGRNGGAPVTGYRIDVSTDQETWTEVASSVSGTTYPPTGLTDGIRYTYRVAAINSFGLGRWSDTVTAITRVVAPGAPANLTAYSYGTSIEVRWQAPASDGGATISGYRIEASTDEATWTELASSVTDRSYLHEGVTTETIYYYRVSARNSEGLGGTATARAVLGPSAPLNLAATADGITINVSWARPKFDGNDPNVTYLVETSTDEETWESLEASTTALSYAHTGLDLATTYHYRVTGRNSVGLGEPSLTMATTGTLPGAPTNVTMNSLGTFTDVRWQAPASDGGATISGYLVEVSTDQQTWTEIASSVTFTSYLHRGVTIGTTYYYRVSARNSIGLGATSDTASVTARAHIAPTAPLDLAAAAHGITINLSWAAPKDDGNDPTLTYLLETSTDEETWETLEASTTALSYAHTGLDLATTYHYRVTARNSFGLGDPSSLTMATTWAALYAPWAPQNVTGIADGTTINLSWEAPDSDGGAAISGYRVESSIDGVTWTDAASSATGTTYAHTGRTLETTYQYRVSARNSEGLSTPSDTTWVTALATVVGPGAPQNLAAASGGRHSIELSWDLPASDGGASVTSYKIERTTPREYPIWSVVVADTGSRDTSYVDGDRDAGSPYFYRVSAINAAGSVGTPSGSSSAVTDRPSVPSAPLNVQAHGGTQEPRVAVWWDPPEDDGGSRSFKGYNLEVSVGTGEERNWVVRLERFIGRTFLDPFAELGTTRTYRVKAVNSVGVGPPSEEVTILVPAIEAGPPRDLTVTLDGPKFKLKWKAPGNNGGADVTGYKIEASTDQVTWHADPDTVTTLHHSLSGLNYAVTYYFRVSAINSAGTGAASATASGQVSCAIWCATATLADHTSNTNLVGYSPANIYSGSTLAPNTFTYDGVDYTVDALVNKKDAGTVTISLSPALTESARSALTLYVNGVALPFSSGSSTGGLVTWSPTALGLSNFGFADGESIRLLMTASESAAD